ncbi:MAG: PAS domain S-box protein, partial [Rhodospirillales bacterium]|nr:PAS domain S-box protein [Rhodospirillales bacterium]
MKISARLIALVIVGFAVTLAVAGVAVFSISRLGGELGNVSDRELPLVRVLTSMTVRQLEMETALERALRANTVLGSSAGDQEIGFEAASHRFTELANDTQDDLRTAVVVAQEALRASTDNIGRTELRNVILQIREIGRLLGEHQGLAQRTFHLIENGDREGAAGNLSELEDQRIHLTAEISRLVFRVEDFARASAQSVLMQQQANLMIMIAVSGIGLIICLTLGWVVARSISRPIRSVTGALGELVRGNTETPLDFKQDRSELGAMAVAMRAFREEIVNRRETVVALAESERRFHALAALSPVGVFSTDAGGNCHYVNEMGCRMTGLSATESLGRGWMGALHPDDREMVLSRWAKAAAADGPFRAEYRFVKPDGSVTWVIGQASQHKDATGNTTGFVGTITDITEQKKAEERLIEYARSRTELHEITADLALSFEEKIQRLLELGAKTFRLPLGIVSHIENDTYTIEHVTGPEDGTPPVGTTFLLGETYCTHALEANGPIGFDRAGESRIRTHPCYTKFGLEAYIGCPIVVNGERYGTLNFSGPEPRPKAFADGDYSLVQLFSQWIGTEISRRHAEEVLRVSEERLKLALEGTEDGMWDWNVASGDIYFSPRFEEILGFGPGEIDQRIPAWEERIHPDDRDSTRQALDDHLRGKTAIFESEHRIRSKTGSWTWVLNRGKVVERDPDGQPLRAVGAHTDITARKRAEDALRESEERVRTLVENIVDGIITIDSHGIIETVNPAVERIFGYESAEMLGKNVKML